MKVLMLQTTGNCNAFFSQVVLFVMCKSSFTQHVCDRPEKMFFSLTVCTDSVLIQRATLSASVCVCVCVVVCVCVCAHVCLCTYVFSVVCVVCVYVCVCVCVCEIGRASWRQRV